MQAVTITTDEASGVEKFETLGITQLEIKDVERLLNISRPSVLKLLATKMIPSFKVGSVTKIPVAGFKKFIATNLAK